MQRESGSFLVQIVRAIDLIDRFVIGKTFDDYLGDEMLRAAVERELTIVGEAISQLVHEDATYQGKITDAARIIAFRNILVHGYAIIQDQLVWDIVESRLPPLKAEVADLIREHGE